MIWRLLYWNAHGGVLARSCKEGFNIEVRLLGMLVFEKECPSSSNWGLYPLEGQSLTLEVQSDLPVGEQRCV